MELCRLWSGHCKYLFIDFCIDFVTSYRRFSHPFRRDKDDTKSVPVKSSSQLMLATDYTITMSRTLRVTGNYVITTIKASDTLEHVWYWHGQTVGWCSSVSLASIVVLIVSCLTEDHDF